MRTAAAESCGRETACAGLLASGQALRSAFTEPASRGPYPSYEAARHCQVVEEVCIRPCTSVGVLLALVTRPTPGSLAPPTL